MRRAFVAPELAVGLLLGLLLATSCSNQDAARNLERAELTKVLVEKLALESYPQWAVTNPTKTCPEAITELLVYTNLTEPVDAWGRPLVMYCGSSLPPGAKGLGVRSRGPDGVEGNADDITSWQ